MNTKAYAAINLNDEVRMKSSSGAVFYELARYVILNGGVVYGAKYDDGWSIIHGHADTIEGIQDFIGSKYAQSDLRDEYKNAENNLKKGHIVLFSGSPCQVEGLKCFLNKNYNNLITLDIICHGVPSPLVWQQYIQKISNGRNITAINFRDKTEGWLNYSLNIDFDDGSCYRITHQKDLYMRGFTQDIYIRPACYQCQFKSIERNSDITLADFWGVDQELPTMFDDKGTSLILIHSDVGDKLWGEVQNVFRYCEIGINDALKHNPSSVTSAEWTSKRDDFFSSEKDKFHVLEQITKEPLKKRLSFWIR